jgi:hypothetical protein
MVGYNVLIVSELSQKEYRFKYLENRRFIEKDLREMGFTMYEVLKASYTPMRDEEIKKEVEAEIDW